MGGSYTAGIISGETEEDVYSIGNGVYMGGVWWGISDTGGIWAGQQGLVGQLPKDSMNSYGVAFGCGDRIGCAIDMDGGTMEFFRNGDVISGAKLLDIPTISNEFHVLASPFNMGSTVQVCAFTLA